MSVELAVETGEGFVFPRKDKFFVATGKGILEILEVQPAGCWVITGRDFLNGYCR